MSDEYIVAIKSINILKDKMSKSPQFKPPATELYKYRFNRKKLNKNEYWINTINRQTKAKKVTAIIIFMNVLPKLKDLVSESSSGTIKNVNFVLIVS